MTLVGRCGASNGVQRTPTDGAGSVSATVLAPLLALLTGLLPLLEALLPQVDPLLLDLLAPLELGGARVGPKRAVTTTMTVATMSSATAREAMT
jgi:hypothetical protein